jgi:hypothetical protein
MGILFFDKYSWLHFSMGIVAYFFRVGFLNWFILHAAFEMAENSSRGVHFIHHNLRQIWPGGKEKPDEMLNSFGDQFWGMCGYLLMVKLYGPIHGDDPSLGTCF